MAVSASTLRRGMNLWPPFLFSGIRVMHIADDFTAVDVELRQRFYNRNYVGTHFGGSIFAMTDPFWMMMVMHQLGREYTVWDRAGEIEFLRPGTGTLRASFRTTPEMIGEIVANTAEDGAKYLPVYVVDILNGENEVVSRVSKTLHIRKRADTRKRIGGS